MRLLPATADAMMRLAISSNISASVPTTISNNCFTVLLYTGVAPTKSQMDTMFNGTPQHSGNNAFYSHMTALLSGRNANYVGGIAGLKPVMTLASIGVPVLSAVAMNTKLVAANTDDRNCYIKADATPTWFLLLGSNSNTINIQTGLESSAGYGTLVVVGSVGDENSGADLQLVGGQVFASASVTDQSKAVIINDITLKFS